MKQVNGKRLRTPQEQAAIDDGYRRIDAEVIRLWHEQYRRTQRRRKFTAFALIGVVFIAATIIIDALIMGGSR